MPNSARNTAREKFGGGVDPSKLSMGLTISSIPKLDLSGIVGSIIVGEIGELQHEEKEQ